MKRSLTRASLASLTLLAALGQTAPAEATPGLRPIPGEPTIVDAVFPEYPELVGSAFLWHFRNGELEQAIATALNSPGDELELDLSGELHVPVFGAVSPGGEFELDVKLSRLLLEDETTAYEVKVAGDLLLGAGASAGPAGAALHTATAVATKWRFATQEEVVMALRCLVIRAALNDQVQNAIRDIERQLAGVDSALSQVRAVRDQFIGWLSRYLPAWVNQRLQTLAQTRSRMARTLTELRNVASLLNESQAFLNARPGYLELELGVELTASVGADVMKAGGDAAGSIGIGAEETLKPSVTMLVEMRDGVPGQTEVALHLESTTELHAGFYASVEIEPKVELVISGSGTFTTNGFEVDTASDLVELSFDRSYAVAGWDIVGAQFAAGRKTSAFTDLSTLLALGREGIEVLVSSENPELAAALLAELPVTYVGQARIQRAAYAGVTADLGEQWFSAGLAASAWWTDQGEVFSYDGSARPEELLPLFPPQYRHDPIQETLDLLNAVADEAYELGHPTGPVLK